MSGNLFSLCLHIFIVNENGRPGVVLLGQHTVHVFIESCMIYGWVLFSGDVDNTLHLFLFFLKDAHCNTIASLHYGITII